MPGEAHLRFLSSRRRVETPRVGGGVPTRWLIGVTAPRLRDLRVFSASLRGGRGSSVAVHFHLAMVRGCCLFLEVVRWCECVCDV